MHHPFIIRLPDTVHPPASLLKTDPCLYLSRLISLQSTNIDTTSSIAYTLTHTLAVLHSPTPETLHNRARISQLFYAYVSLIPKVSSDNKPLAEILLLVNYLRKDLQSVNIYTRSRSMRSVAHFMHPSLSTIISNWTGPILENLDHNNEMVRVTALDVLFKMYLTGSSVEIVSRMRSLVNEFCGWNLYKECIKRLFVVDGDVSFNLPTFSDKKLTNENFSTGNDNIKKDSLEKNLNNNETIRKDHDEELKDDRNSNANVKVIRNIDDLFIAGKNIKDVPENVLDLLVRLSSDIYFIFVVNTKAPYYSSLKILQYLVDNNKLRDGLRIDEFNLDNIVTSLFNCQRRSDALTEVILRNVPSHVFVGHTSEIIDIVFYNNSMMRDTYEKGIIEMDVIYDFIFSSIKTPSDTTAVTNCLYQVLCSSSPQNQIKTLQIIKNHNATASDPRIINQVREMINNPNPGVSHECLDFLKHVPGLFVDIGSILYGKILRKAISVIGERINDINGLTRYLIVFEDSLNKAEQEYEPLDKNKGSIEQTRKSILHNLNAPSSPYIGNFIALFFEKTAKRICIDDDLRARMIALLLRFIVQGEKTGKIDRSSYLTITMCIRSIYNTRKNVNNSNLNDVDKVQTINNVDSHTKGKVNDSNLNDFDKIETNENSYDKVNADDSNLKDVDKTETNKNSYEKENVDDSNLEDVDKIECKTNKKNYEKKNLTNIKKFEKSRNKIVENSYKKGNINDAISFPLIGSRKITKKISNVISYTPEKIYQLTGISDPIFIEAKVTINISGITIDMLLVNQTKSMLQNINIEFTTSSNISKKENNQYITVMQAGEIKNFVVKFKLEECSDGFICGSTSFNFPGERGQYSGSIYEMNTGEITFEIKDFLTEPKKLQKGDFRDKWTTLEWENTYSLIKNNNNKEIKNLTKIRTKIIEALNGILDDEQGDSEFVLSNIVCETMLGDKILINMILIVDENIIIECRIRSTAENMVKSISGIISETMKNIQI